MKKLLIAPILLFIVLLIIVYFVVPEYQKFRNLKEEISQREEQLLKIESYFSNLNRILEELENYQDSLGKIKTGLPEDFSFPSLLTFFAKKSSEAGLLLKNMSVGEVGGTKKEKEEKASSKIKEAYFHLELTGFYSSLKSFVKDIERSSRLVDIESISINAEGGKKEELLSYNVKIKVYSFKE